MAKTCTLKFLAKRYSHLLAQSREVRDSVRTFASHSVQDGRSFLHLSWLDQGQRRYCVSEMETFDEAAENASFYNRI